LLAESQPRLDVRHEFAAGQQSVSDPVRVDGFAEDQIGARLLECRARFRRANDDGKGAPVGLQFPRSLEQEASLQTLIPIDHDQVKGPAGQAFQRGKDFLTGFYLELELTKSLVE
jgi:hypothetical protein